MLGFIDLPPEIRLMIHRLLLPEQTLFAEGFSIKAVVPLADRRDQDPPGSFPRMTFPNIFRANRQIFEEIYPLLYSQHEFSLLPSRGTIRFLRRIGQLNRDALREINLEYVINPMVWFKLRVSYDPLKSRVECKYPGRDAKLFNVLSKCSNVSITIMTTLRTLAQLDGFLPYPALANMHGFMEATYEVSRIPPRYLFARIDYVNCHQLAVEAAIQERLEHGENLDSDEAAAKAAIQQRLDYGVKRLESPCPKGCRVHKRRSSRHKSATIHLEVECEYDSWEHAYRSFLSTHLEREGSIFVP